MKPPLADFSRPVTPSDANPNLFRGSVSAIVALFVAYLIFANATTVAQYDRDGVIDTGVVDSVTTQTSRRRRGRISIRYTATVTCPHGWLSIPVDSNIKPGGPLRYIFSPSLNDAIAAPEPLQRGDMLRHELFSWEATILGFASLLMTWYAYNQFRWLYIVHSGRYTVKGKPPTSN